MKCPVDGTELVMSERQNVEIDYCPQCRGVWLDRGELDKIIERVETEGVARTHVTPPQHGPHPEQSYRETYHPPRQEYRDYDDDHKHGYPGQHGHHKKRHDSWLGDLFD